eukprot:COSAG02_NODE_1033_length_15063_cov_14.987503_6_plen_81_part_00
MLGIADFIALEALVDTSASATASVALHRYVSKSSGDLCLSSEVPGVGYTRVNASAPAEGYCSPHATELYTQPIVLWYAER